MREHACHDDHRREKRLWGEREELSQRGVDVTGAVSDTDAYRRHDHHAERGERREVGDGCGHELDETVGCEHVDDLNLLVSCGIDVVEVHERQKRRDDENDHESADEERRDVGNLVADSNDEPEDAFGFGFLRWGRGGGGVRRHGSSFRRGRPCEG